MSQVTFTVYGKPQPQGSIKSFQHKTTGAIVSMSTNKNLKPFRVEVGRMAVMALNRDRIDRPMALSEEPVEICIEFTFQKPKTCPKGRVWPTVKPDIDKLERAVLDALTGILYVDDSQVVSVVKTKVYGPHGQTHITARVMTEGKLF